MAGQGNYLVKQGDCIYSIAKAHGFLWETLWNLPENAELKQTRKDPAVLYPGDLVFVPEPREKEEPGETERRHRFRLMGTPSKLVLRFLDEKEKPRAGETYVLSVDGKQFKGVLDGDGRVEVVIPPDAKQGKIKIGEEEEYPLDLGYLDPVDEVTGAQARLKNLGYYTGPINGNLDASTSGALAAFQRNRHLKATGQLDEATRNRLKETHDKD